MTRSNPRSDAATQRCEGECVASMQAMSENTAISSFPVFIEGDCSNLVGGNSPGRVNFV